MGTRLAALALAAMATMLSTNDAGASLAPAAPTPAAGGCSLPRDVALNPGACFTFTGVKTKDAGILRSYRELSEITLTNTSSYKIGSITGEVTWIKGDGSSAGSTTFSLVGTVPVNGTTAFSQAAKNLTTTKIQTDAPSYRVSFTTATVVE